MSLNSELQPTEEDCWNTGV